MGSASSLHHFYEIGKAIITMLKIMLIASTMLKMIKKVCPQLLLRLGLIRSPSEICKSANGEGRRQMVTHYTVPITPYLFIIIA